MQAIILSAFKYLFTTKLIKVIAVSAIEVLVQRTDNKVDDEILAKVKEKL